MTEKISATKTREKFSQVMKNIRTKISFEIVGGGGFGGCTWSSRKDWKG